MPESSSVHPVRAAGATAGYWNELEPLWITALALLIVVPGYLLGPRIIQFFGRGGQVETVESIVYLVVLVGFPIGAAAVGYLIPRKLGATSERVVKRTLLILLLAGGVAELATTRALTIAAALAMSVITAALLTERSAWSGSNSAADRDAVIARAVALVFVGAGAWMSAGALVSWSDATGWLTGTIGRFALFAVTFGFVVAAIRDQDQDQDQDQGQGQGQGSARSVRTQPFASVAAVAAVALLVALSFRTNPVLESHHWDAYVGPMQALRQGGWLLWDAPARYGLLAMLLPTLFPGNAWQAFYLFQGICNVVVALLMFRVLRGLRPTIASTIVAAALTATTLFFRPRTATLLLAGQMTPSGGPVRFIWCFVMLAFLFGYYRNAATGRRPNHGDRSGSNFALWGNLIWLASILWSVEIAIYCSAIWFPAYLIYLLQRSAGDKRGGKKTGRIVREFLRSIVWPFATLAAIVVAIDAYYRVALGHFPDWVGYFEYALQYGGGFRTLTIDPSGSVWFLLVVFLIVSTAAVMYLCSDPGHPRVIVLAGAWGGIWAISSYFVSRSHPANLLSIATFLVFAAAVTLSVLVSERQEPWHAFVRVAIVPVFVMPIVLTIGHPGFLAQITTPQLSYASFTEQIPLMEASLNDLLLRAGAKPSDPVVRIGDGRLMLPAWRTGEGNRRVVSPYSWLPKQYEIIGTLSASRRRKYIDRNADRLRLSGWLVHSKTGAIPDYAQQIEDISRTHMETKRFENNDWIVSWYQLRRR